MYAFCLSPSSNTWLSSRDKPAHVYVTICSSKHGVSTPNEIDMFICIMLPALHVSTYMNVWHLFEWLKQWSVKHMWYVKYNGLAEAGLRYKKCVEKANHIPNAHKLQGYSTGLKGLVWPHLRIRCNFCLQQQLGDPPPTLRPNNGIQSANWKPILSASKYHSLRHLHLSILTPNRPNTRHTRAPYMSSWQAFSSPHGFSTASSTSTYQSNILICCHGTKENTQILIPSQLLSIYVCQPRIK